MLVGHLQIVQNNLGTMLLVTNEIQHNRTEYVIIAMIDQWRYNTVFNMQIKALNCFPIQYNYHHLTAGEVFSPIIVLQFVWSSAVIVNDSLGCINIRHSVLTVTACTTECLTSIDNINILHSVTKWYIMLTNHLPFRHSDIQITVHITRKWSCNMRNM